MQTAAPSSWSQSDTLDTVLDDDIICKTDSGVGSPTCPDAPLYWLTCDCRSLPGPASADGHHAEVVPSPWKHPRQDAYSQLGLCDGQAVLRGPLQLEAVIVPRGGTRPRQLYRIIGRPLFDGQVSGRFWSWGRSEQDEAMKTPRCRLHVLTSLTCSPQC